jgi:hypothetical protein
LRNCRYGGQRAAATCIENAESFMRLMRLMRRSTGSLALTALTVAGVAAGCADAAPPSAPASPPPVAAGPAPAPVTPVATAPTRPLGLAPASAFPALVRPGAVYAADLSLYEVLSASHGGWLASRLVLYEASGNQFGLQFASPAWGFFEYGGRYAPFGTEVGAELAFQFDGWNTAGPWTATGTLRGDTLRLAYNPVMQMADFIDGVYVRVPDVP